MNVRVTQRLATLLMLLLAGGAGAANAAEPLGEFDPGRDLFLAHFDLKTDVDDLHSIAGVATMLADPRFAGVRWHAVAGAYGTQAGPYVPANELFRLAFGERWSDAHADADAAAAEVATLAAGVLRAGGRVWVAEAGQSDFTAAVLRVLQAEAPDVDLQAGVTVVQHSDWNEDVTTPEDLAFVKRVATYRKLPDGNAVGNGTPGFRSDREIAWRDHVTDARLRSIWEMALTKAHLYNGVEGRYLNQSMAKGGLDFSDVSETTWIFGFRDLADADDFFEGFATAAASGE